MEETAKASRRRRTSAPDYLTEDEAATLLRLSPRTLQRHRHNSTGPAFSRLGARRVVYDRKDLVAWAHGGRSPA